MRLARLIFALGIFSCAGAFAQVPEFPQHDFTGHFMQEAFPSRIQKLAARMQASMAKHKDWAVGYIQAAPAGKPLPYHPNLGVTESEYQEFLSGIKKAELKEVFECDVKVRPNEKGKLGFETGRAVPLLESLTFDPRTGTVSTPYGDFSHYQHLNQTDGGAIGPWTGYYASLEKGDLAHGSGKILTLTTGKRIADNKSFIYYKFKVAKNSQILDAGELILFYDEK